MTLAGTPEQAVILVGGLGTRLAELTKNHPKPLLTVGDAPFLDELIWRLERYGFRRLLLLAGHRAEKFTGYLAQYFQDKSMEAELIVEPHPLGTAGALHFAADKLDGSFYLLNGDSLFDFNWLDLIPLSAERAPLVAMGLRREADASRFGVVDVNGDQVTGFRERGGPSGGIINGGVYLVSRDIVPYLPENGSLEREVLPKLAVMGRVMGRVYGGFFLDIGTPDSFARAPALLRANKQRPAIFFDGDCVVRVDRAGGIDWAPGAVEAMKSINDNGRYAFLMLKRTGAPDAGDLPAQAVDAIQRDLRARGAHIDSVLFYSGVPGEEEKSQAGAIIDVMSLWPADSGASLLVSAKPLDQSVAAQAGIAIRQFSGGNLFDFTAPLLR